MEKDGSGSAESVGRSAGAGSWLAVLSEPVEPPLPSVEMTAVATMAATAAVASAPPPISSQLLAPAPRRADASASAAQSGV